ncbi:MAG: enoyl-CoA hydratase-related protein, partial [bacterium]
MNERKIHWETLKDFEDILYQFYKGIAKISINRPEVHNAFRPKTVFELSEAFELARQNTDVGV